MLKLLPILFFAAVNISQISIFEIDGIFSNSHINAIQRYVDENDLRGGISLNTRISKKELFNAVKGLYTEPDNNYQPQDYPILTNSTFETEDNSERIFGEFNFPMTTSSHTVQRLAKIQLLLI